MDTEVKMKHSECESFQQDYNNIVASYLLGDSKWQLGVFSSTG
jgi:hypothetical protein